MADKLAVIQSQETIAELEAINKQTLELIGTFNQLVAVSKDVSSGLTKGTPKDFIASEKQLVAIQKQKAQVLKELAEAEKRLAAASISVEKANIQALKAQKEKLNSDYSELRVRKEKANAAQAEAREKIALLNVGTAEIKQDKELANAVLAEARARRELGKIAQDEARVKLQLEQIETQTARTRAQNANAENAEIRLKQQKLRLSAQEEKAAQQLSSAYMKLNAEHIKLRNVARDAAVTHGINSQEFRKAAAAANLYDQQLKKIDASLGQHNRGVGNYSKALGGISGAFRNLLGAFGVVGAVNVFASITRSSYAAVKSLDAMNIALKTVFETEQEYLIQKQFLNEITDRYGLDLLKTTESYTKFSAAVKGTALEGEEARRVFAAFGGAASKLGLNVEQQEGIFRALEQMISKGTIQAEELRGQLGDRMPGAFRLFAKAMGVSTVELNKLLRDGKVLSDDVLPKVADELAKNFNLLERTDTLNAAQNRFTREWMLFLEELSSNENVIYGIKTSLEGLSAVLESMVNMIIDKGEDGNTVITNLTDAISALIGILFDMASNLGMVDKEQKNVLFSMVQFKNDLAAMTSMAEVTAAAIKFLAETIGNLFKLGDGWSEFTKKTEDSFLAAIDEYKKVREAISDANKRGVSYNDEIRQTKAYQKAWKDARDAKFKYFSLNNRWFDTATGRNTGKSTDDYDEHLNKRIKPTGVSGLGDDGGSAKKAETSRKKAESERLRAQREKEAADRKAYNAQKKLLDDELKLLEQNLENKMKIAKEDPYLSNVEKITEQVSIYSQLISANENYYDRLIQAARKYNQETESLQSQRILKNNTLTDASDNVMTGMPKAIKDDIEYQRELQDLIIAAGNAEDRRRIIANSTLSIKQKERLMAIQEIEDERELLELQKERLLEDVARLSPMYLSGTLTREQRKEWETVNKQLEEVGENLEKNKTILEQTKVNALKDDLAPLIGLISGSLGAGDSFTSALDAILNKQSTMMDKFVASAKFAGDLLTEFFRNQADARIAELDRQLEYSRQATETELSFVEQRFEVLNAMSELTEEQNQERLALEDEARVIKEQQHLREKQIEAERLRAQQRAQAQQAIINGLLAATQTLAQTGATPLGWGLAAAAAAFGVAQAVAIMSKNPVPEYFKGRDGGKAEWAITQDRYGAEAISDKHGNIKTWGTDSGAKLTWLEDGDKVHTAAETKQLMSRLAQKGTPNINIIHNDNPVDYDKLADKVGSRFEKVLRKFDKVTFTEDERGNVFMQEAGKIPVFKGRKKQQPIKINIKGNDRN